MTPPGHTHEQRQQRCGDWYLPDFCQVPVIFSVVLVAQLCAFALVLAAPKPDIWLQISRTSLFIQWIVLTCAACLCASGPLLRRLAPHLATATAYLMLLAVTAFYSLAGGWAMGPEYWSRDDELMGSLGFLLRNLSVSAIIGAMLLRYAYVQHQWQQRVQSEARARFDALQARIRPHFLFNCMNTIASLTRTRPEQAEAVVENLAELFRASLTDGHHGSTLEDELALTRRYLDIERLRLGDRLRVNWELDGVPQDGALPSLSLQPLAENAVYYGVERSLEGGSIDIDAQRRDGQILIRLRNPVAPPHIGRHRRGNGMAVDNVRRRLEAFFGGAAGLDVEQAAGEYQVTVRVPYRSAPEPSR